MRQFYVYILASRSRRLYVGVTSNLLNRVFAHRQGWSDFTARYRINRLVYFETCDNSVAAIAREKQIKAWRREKRVALIEQANPTWDDLAADWFEEKAGKQIPRCARDDSATDDSAMDDSATDDSAMDDSATYDSAT